jgi:hypothetical protein
MTHTDSSDGERIKRPVYGMISAIQPLRYAECTPAKGSDCQWVRVPSGNELLQLTAIGAMEEATNTWKPLME